VLYHSLQVFTLASDLLPYDEEFRLAALLHDVGKGIDPHEHVTAGLRALGNAISERTAWLIEQHSLALDLLDGRIGVRARRRLQQSADYDELILLAKCDLAGRVPGAKVPELDEALSQLRDLALDNE
jgi:predicted HD phosphohydrolase